MPVKAWGGLLTRAQRVPGEGWSWAITFKAHFLHPGHLLPKDRLPPETEPATRDHVSHSSSKLSLKGSCSSRAPVRKKPMEATGQSSSVISLGTLSHCVLLLWRRCDLNVERPALLNVWALGPLTMLFGELLEPLENRVSLEEESPWGISLEDLYHGPTCYWLSESWEQM